MMDTYYTAEQNVQMLIALMKAHHIKKVIASPGTTNVTFVASIQQDPYFKIYSAADERSAAYMACGLAAESGEPVALSCTGATASRNYIPALTEAFYRKLPVLAITSTQHMGRIGQNIPQVIDRTVLANDIAKLSVQIPTIHDTEDKWACEVQINKALLELRRHGGGPAHINLVTTYDKNFTVKELPTVRTIQRYMVTDPLPELKAGRVAIFVGAHKSWSEELTQAVETFCEVYNAVVLYDHTSNYVGKYGVLASLVSSQEGYTPDCIMMDTLIDIGDISGAYTSKMPKEVWRVNPDGEVRDTYKKLVAVFEMEEIEFFQRYIHKKAQKTNCSYAQTWQEEFKELENRIPDLPFSNIWIASKTASLIPENTVLHLGILNTLRSWNFFELPKSVRAYANTGGFGIDGNTSALIGASLADPEKIYFGVTGDLSFFYDMNSIGNHNIGKNLRIMVINNGKGTEFRNYNHPAARFNEEADCFMAAAGHYGNQSRQLLLHYAQDLGFEYLSASNKEQYLKEREHFLEPILKDKPILFEVFTDWKDESDALKIMYHLKVNAAGTAKQIVKNVLGEKGVQTVKKMMGR